METKEKELPTEAATNFYATGRRKSATARVWIFKGQKGFKVNGLDYPKFFPRLDLQIIVEQPFKETNTIGKFRVRAKVKGGGVAGQAGAVRLGIARALLVSDPGCKEILRRNGFLTRDPREKERKKPGRKGARRSFQYTKR
ncbi:MAG: 30S ribosomal protein S9 [Candidatus Omnitrophica bacterium]|nr:30S ribosomal protein S9 [Candidatus Omnitrophota bacterium]